ncbi:hypothetical protein [Methylobacterium sp. Leaf108]|uniref:hypothetical protein n=1 Tax=Methylobacterium sp. Leaf108 TaxID=1736256 RepID=UPI000A4D0EE6|nr:hypothetical protein [Methylobacterium sp. Leaf108]
MTLSPIRLGGFLAIALLGPASAQPVAPPAEGSAAQQLDLPKLDPKRNNAVRLAGLVGFVNESCPDLKPDYERFKQVLSRLGVDPADLEGNELRLHAMSYIEAYRKDVPANCARAVQNFGEAGTTVPGLIGKR